MVGNKVERLKFIGRREMDMNANIKSVFDESDENYYKPYFNDAKELFWTDDDFSQGEQLVNYEFIISKNKINWETFNTQKIRTVFYSNWWTDNDFGTRIRLKCHKPLNRKKQTLDGELCTNWQLIDSFGVRLDFDDSQNNTGSHQNFYDDSRGYRWEYPGKRLWYYFYFCKKQFVR